MGVTSSSKFNLELGNNIYKSPQNTQSHTQFHTHLHYHITVSHTNPISNKTKAINQETTTKHTISQSLCHTQPNIVDNEETRTCYQRERHVAMFLRHLLGKQQRKTMSFSAQVERTHDTTSFSGQGKKKKKKKKKIL